MKPHSNSMEKSRVRVRFNPFRSHELGFTHLTIVFILLHLTPTITASPNAFRQIPYAQHCNAVVPESKPTYRKQINYENNLQLQNAHVAVAVNDPLLGSPKSVTLRTTSMFETEAKRVFKIEAGVHLQGSLQGNFNRRKLRLINYRPPRIPIGDQILGFRLHGFWSESSGKLCMVGSGTRYLNSLNVVLKLNYPNSSTIETSLVTGTLGFLNSPNHVEPISILGLSMMNYEHKLVYEEIENGGFSGFDKLENDSLSIDHRRLGLCSVFKSFDKFELEYSGDCESVNCNPLGGDDKSLPSFVSFNEIECLKSTWKGKARYVLDFSNTSYSGWHLPFVPNTSLVAEGVWNQKMKHLDVVACRIPNVVDSAANAALEDCSVRMSLRFPATISLRNRSNIVGNIWSTKSGNDSGYFHGLSFRGLRNGIARSPGLKYEYTMIDAVSKSCAKKMIGKPKKGAYPSGSSSDMRFDMSVKNIKGQVAWGYASPIFVNDNLYKTRRVFSTTASSGVEVNNNGSGKSNISYTISFLPPPGFKLGGKVLPTKQVGISAEGIYDDETGVLCMVGCLHLETLNRRLAKNKSLDCQIHINIQYPPLRSKDGSIVKGTIESTRQKTDPLYFGRLDLGATSIFKNQAKDSIWRMDLEIGLVLVSNTLACIFVGLQLLHVKKHPEALPFISVVMLAALTLGHMIPLVLNFEALFVRSHNRQNVFLGSGGWVEVNEVLVRVITMVAFLLQFRLLQQVWSARSSDESWKSLWVSDKKVLFLSLPLYIGGGLIAWFVHQWRYSHQKTTPVLGFRHRWAQKQHQSFWGDFKSYAGLILDGFLLPQIVFNVFCSSKEKALAPSFYVGTTIVRLLPHAYDFYRSRGSSTWYLSHIYADPGMDFYSTAWDIVISISGLLFVIVIFLQQRFGGHCFLPKRFRDSAVYEKVIDLSGL